MDTSGKQIIRTLSPHYRTGQQDLGAEFFAPSLQYCCRYQRATGYFSSSALITWAGALPSIASREDVSIQLIISPEMSAEDVAALERTVDVNERLRICAQIVDRIVDAALLLKANPGLSGIRLRLLMWLVATDRLKLRFAFPAGNPVTGLFHEKIGIFTFPWGDQIAFTGSANETISGHSYNYESLDVYRSWVEGDGDRVITKVRQFEEAWTNSARGLTVLPLSAASLAKVKTLAPKQNPLEQQPAVQVKRSRWLSPEAPQWRHQDEATEVFLHVRHGILEMATGTGKTRTALKILSRLVDGDLVDGAIITAEGTDLLDQWRKEMDEWAFEQRTGFRVLQHYERHHDLAEFALNPREAVLIVSRNQLHKLFARLKPNRRHTLIIVHDEIHGLGSPALRSSLAGEHLHFPYRLGLSATPEREYDEEGNHFIEAEIGPTIYEFQLEDAISRGILCEFDYIPLEYVLTDADRERLKQVFAWKAAREAEGQLVTEAEIWIALSRVYKTAEMKPSVFQKYLEDAPDVVRRAILFVETKEYGERILEMLHAYTRLYRTYYAEDDRDHLERFARGEIDCLLTCHRVSEGIDIRGLENVVLFSSARAQLETIQRIGRCLRTDPAKPDKRARVVDFVRKPEPRDSYPSGDSNRSTWLRRLSDIRRVE